MFLSVDEILLFEGITAFIGFLIVLSFIIYYVLIGFIVALQKCYELCCQRSSCRKSQCFSCCKSSCCAKYQKQRSWIIKYGTRLLANVPIKLFLQDVRPATLREETVVVVNGFILKPKQVLKLSTAIVYFGLAFLMIVVRTSFITEETSKFSACFTGGLLDKKTYDKCLIFYNVNMTSKLASYLLPPGIPILASLTSDPYTEQLTSDHCENFNCLKCPNINGAQYTIFCQQSTPDVITALAGIFGFVTGTRLILSIYSSIMFNFAGLCVWGKKSDCCCQETTTVKLQNNESRCDYVCCFIWWFLFNLVFIGGFIFCGRYIIYLIFKNSAEIKRYIYFCEFSMYILGLMMVMQAIPWYSAERYGRNEELKEVKAEEQLMSVTIALLPYDNICDDIFGKSEYEPIKGEVNEMTQKC